MAIKCCYGCVPPKRHEACHGHCPEYIEEKNENDAQSEAIRKQRSISCGLTAQRTAGVTKALREKRYKNVK